MRREVAAVLDWEQAHLGDPLSDWGRLAAEDLLGNLDLTQEARQVMQQALQRYGRSDTRPALLDAASALQALLRHRRADRPARLGCRPDRRHVRRADGAAAVG